MANRHHLSLDILDTATPSVLRLSDTSAYTQLLPIDCPQLEITPPGFIHPTFVTSLLSHGFLRTITARDLGMQVTVDDDPRYLPDGVWKISYAVAPVDYTRVTYLHLRTTQTLNRYYTILGRLGLDIDCTLSSEQEGKLRELRKLFSLLQAAKAQVEYCHAPVKGQQILSYVEQQLTRFEHPSCWIC